MEDVKTRNMRSALQPTFNHTSIGCLHTELKICAMSCGKINDSWEHIIIISEELSYRIQT